ncbi:formate/nitrite transporter family protein [Tepidiforma sp.]|uniref:formate/nitrite transporter family protein n=1 Tax=Tepidiforma sp. TaxID=2682230 RepID=UPI002ADD7A69|nr:formate/nitrite transporter family protein [Tepidiforma sp.]
MTTDALEACSKAAAAKAAFLREKPHGYLILSALAGIYVGFGIVLIFAIGAPLSVAGSPFLKFVMGASFGIALSLVIVAGSELFTGNTLVMTVGALRGAVPVSSLAGTWAVSLAGNLAGSLALAWLVAQSGALGAAPQADFIQKIAAAKMTLSFEDAFFRGILCNWLVCLAVWSAMRQQSEAGKLIMIFWCLFAFIGAGFEHSVANMTLLGIALFQPHADSVSWAGFAHNLIPVTLGNIVGGAVFVAGAYLLANARLALPRPAETGATQVTGRSAAAD